MISQIFYWSCSIKYRIISCTSTICQSCCGIKSLRIIHLIRIRPVWLPCIWTGITDPLYSIPLYTVVIALRHIYDCRISVHRLHRNIYNRRSLEIHLKFFKLYVFAVNRCHCCHLSMKHKQGIISIHCHIVHVLQQDSDFFHLVILICPNCIWNIQLSLFCPIRIDIISSCRKIQYYIFAFIRQFLCLIQCCLNSFCAVLTTVRCYTVLCHVNYGRVRFFGAAFKWSHSPRYHTPR